MEKVLENLTSGLSALQDQIDGLLEDRREAESLLAEVDHKLAEIEEFARGVGFEDILSRINGKCPDSRKALPKKDSTVRIRTNNGKRKRHGPVAPGTSLMDIVHRALKTHRNWISNAEMAKLLGKNVLRGYAKNSLSASLCCLVSSGKAEKKLMPNSKRAMLYRAIS